MALALSSSRFLDAVMLSSRGVCGGGGGTPPPPPFPLGILRTREDEDVSVPYTEAHVLTRQQLRNRTMLEGIYSPSITPQEQLLDTLRHVWVIEQQQQHHVCHPSLARRFTRLGESDKDSP